MSFVSSNTLYRLHTHSKNTIIMDAPTPAGENEARLNKIDQRTNHEGDKFTGN